MVDNPPKNAHAEGRNQARRGSMRVVNPPRGTARREKYAGPGVLANVTRAGRILAAILTAQGGLAAANGADAAMIQHVDQIRARLIAYHFPIARSEQPVHPSLSRQAQYWPNWNSWRSCYGYYGWVPRTERPWRWPIR
jgi:hypothetical protein